MKKLRNKTFYTIFYIISLFIIILILLLNFQSYQKEYKNIHNNLTRMNNMLNNNQKPINKKNENELLKTDLNNKIIMDYNFYTILLDQNNNIIDKISHNENEFSSEIIAEAEKILSKSKNSEIKIKLLYLNKIAYSLEQEKFLIIADISNVQKRLLIMLSLSLVILILFEIITYYVAKKITDWITKPVEDSFNNQKEFIANASHELKTPLAVIMASIDCLEVDKQNEKWLNNLKSESERMNDLISRLLDLSKTENQLNKENLSLNNLSKIVSKRILIFESLAFENNVKIESNITKDIMFKCQESDIDELISIMIDNAIKHSFKNSIIKVNLYRVKNNIVIDIINNGDSIPKEEQEKIFERFYRSDKSRNRNSNRYGLGLAIAKNIVTNYNGNISVSSENNYTTFKIIFKNFEH